MKIEKILATFAICAVSATCLSYPSNTDFSNLNFGITSYAETATNFSMVALSEENSTCSIFDFTTSSTELVIPDTVSQVDADTGETKVYTVTDVDFTNASTTEKNKVTSVVIPATVETISATSFKDFKKLTSITFDEGSNLKSIGQKAFFNTGLKSITLNCEKLTTIDSMALGYTSSSKVKDGFTIECYTYNKDIVNNYANDTGITVKVLDETATEFKGASITLDGKIGVNFYMTFSNDVLNDTASKVVLSTSEGILTEIPVTNWSLDSTYGMYKFTAYVNSNEMDKDVTATLVTSNESTVMGTSSVNSYIVALKNQEGGNATLTDLADSIKTYGECSSAYFTDGATISDSVKKSIDSQFGDTSLDDYAMSSEGNVTGLTYGKSSLVLNSGTKIKHYFTLSDDSSTDNYTFKVHRLSDNVEVPCEVKFLDNTCVVYIDNIDACNLNEFYVLDIVNTDTGEQYTLKYSALSYADIVLNQPPTSTVKNLDTLQYLMKSLYLYNSCANAYKQQQ